MRTGRSSLLAVFLGLLPTACLAADVRRVVTEEDVVEELLYLVLDGNKDFASLGLSRESIQELKKERQIQDYAKTLVAKAGAGAGAAGMNFATDVTVGHVYSLSGAIKNDICNNFRGKSNYMDRYVPMTGKVRQWLKLWATCADVGGDAVLSANRHVLVKLVPGSVEDRLKLFPESYGVTVVLDPDSPDGKFEFRTVSEAKEFLAEAKEGLVRKVVFYGHGFPGTMSIGKETLNARDIVAMLRGKMAKEAQAQLVGCNTASVPLTVDYREENVGLVYDGLSYSARRLAYYSAFCRGAGTGRKQCNEQWNEDLAKAVSDELPGVRVCGLRTFGLVPARLFGKDRIEPGWVIGQQGCYKK